MIHERSDRTTLALLRIWVFGIWFVQLLRDPIERLSALPDDLFRPPGFLRLVPNGLWTHLLAERSLLAFRVILLTLLFLVAIGVFRRPYVPVFTAALVAVYQALVRGYSGHMNHAEIMLLWATMIIVFFPMSNVLSVRRPLRRAPGVDASARAAVVTITILFAVSYFFVAAVRLWKGLDLFTTDSLRNNVARQWISTGRLEGGVYRLPAGTPTFDTLPGWLFQFLYVGATLLELVVPLVLVSKWARRTVPPGLFVFHVMNIVWLGIPFVDDMLMLVLFSDLWLPAFGRWLADLEARVRAPSTAGVPQPAPLTTQRA
jgi:hypothetical protein